MGSSNVTKASVVCMTGVANANLNGTFKMVRYSFGPNYGDVGDLLSATAQTCGMCERCHEAAMKTKTSAF